jgi:replication initiation protein RepC
LSLARTARTASATRKTNGGSIDKAFGFSLAPLLARAGEIEQLAAEVKADRLQLRRMRERLTLCRRDIAKLIEVAIEEAMPGDWETIHEHFRSLVLSIPRVETVQDLASVAEELEMLREEIANQLEMRMKTQESSGNLDQTERHIELKT